MNRRTAKGPIRLPRPRRLGVYAVALGLWVSGVGWLILHYGFQRQGEFGPQTSPLEPWALKLHGAFAFAALWTMGLLWAAHIVNGWSVGRRRWSGAGLLGLLLFLTLTGYLLYYAGDDTLRAAVSRMHWIAGLGVLIAFLLHRLARDRVKPGRDPEEAIEAEDRPGPSGRHPGPSPKTDPGSPSSRNAEIAAAIGDPQ
jgi:hypothetical protein